MGAEGKTRLCRNSTAATIISFAAVQFDVPDYLGTSRPALRKGSMILRGRLTRRAAQKDRESLHRREVSSLRAGREGTDRLVRDHAPAQRVARRFAPAQAT